MTTTAPPRHDTSASPDPAHSSGRKHFRSRRQNQGSVQGDDPRVETRPVSPKRRPKAPVSWRRAPFAGLVTALLGLGMVGLLMINNSLAAGSFEQARLRADRILLFEEEQALNQEVLYLSSPTRLRTQARALGMLLATPAYVNPETGEIIGVPTRAGDAQPASAPEGDPAGTEDAEAAGTEDAEAADDSVAGDGSALIENVDPAVALADDPGLSGVPQAPSDSDAALSPNDPGEPKPGDGASLSDGTAYDRAVVSGADVSGATR